MKIKKAQLETLFNVTKGTEGTTTMEQSRKRDAFIKPLISELETFFKDREVIYKAYCVNKEDGTPDLIEGNKYQFEPENIEAVTKEITILNDEEVDIETFETLKEILEKTTYSPKIGETETIDQIILKL